MNPSKLNSSITQNSSRPDINQSYNRILLLFVKRKPCQNLALFSFFFGHLCVLVDKLLDRDSNPIKAGSYFHSSIFLIILLQKTEVLLQFLFVSIHSVTFLRLFFIFCTPSLSSSSHYHLPVSTSSTLSFSITPYTPPSILILY